MEITLCGSKYKIICFSRGRSRNPYNILDGCISEQINNFQMLTIVTESLILDGGRCPERIYAMILHNK